MSNYVLLIDQAKNPMNPIHPAQAKKLLDSGKAAVFRRYPFTLIMNRKIGNIVTHPLSLRIDPGSKATGIALVTDRGDVIWGMELTHRGGMIKDSIQTRSAIRRGRRARKTRYRQTRFLNRKRPEGWLPPSLMHRVLTTETWVKRLIKFAPIGEIRQELVRFDLQKIENPEISGIEYQQGELYGYEVREYLLEKWDRQCSYCGKKDVPLQVEHMTAKALGGTNRVSNLCLACEPCNKKKGKKTLEEFVEDKDKLAKLKAKAKAPLKDATAVSATRWKLYETLKATGLPVITGSGGKTKFNRIRLGLEKTHWIDAACVGDVSNLTIKTTKVLKVKAVGWGTRRLCRIDKNGFPCSRPRKAYDTPWKTGDIAKTSDGVTGRVVVQNEKRIEIRVDKKRHYCKPEQVKPIHRKDGYSYA